MSAEIISYHNFAYYYNQLIPIEFYEDVVTRLKDIKDFDNILDLACGSGTLCFMMKNQTNEVTGLDLSQEMLMIAQDYNIKHKKGVQFINQDMTQLQLHSNVYDLVTCTLDSLNYIEYETDINSIIEKVSTSLQDGGYFCFDLLTQFYIDNIVENHYQCEEINDFEYVWQVNKINDHSIRHDLKILTDDNQYSEVHYQYIHDFTNIEEQLNNNDLKIIEKRLETNELDNRQASRVYYLCKKER